MHLSSNCILTKCNLTVVTVQSYQCYNGIAEWVIVGIMGRRWSISAHFGWAILCVVQWQVFPCSVSLCYHVHISITSALLSQDCCSYMSFLASHHPSPCVCFPPLGQVLLNPHQCSSDCIGDSLFYSALYIPPRWVLLPKYGCSAAGIEVP